MATRTRYSPQRAVIKKIVSEQEGHLSVEEICKIARKKNPRIGRTTVYRDLQQLTELGEVSAMQGPNHLSYYERFTEPHHHFICTQCESIRNLETPNVSMCTACITSKTPLKIEQIVTTLMGKCEKCLTDT